MVDEKGERKQVTTTVQNLIEHLNIRVRSLEEKVDALMKEVVQVKEKKGE